MTDDRHWPTMPGSDAAAHHPPTHRPPCRRRRDPVAAGSGGHPPPAGSPALPGGAPPPRRNRGLLAAVAVLAVVALVAGGLSFVWTRTGDDGSTSAAGPADVDPGDTTTTEPLSPAEFEAQIAELQAFVEEERGLEFREDVEVELAGDEEFEARLIEDFEEDREDLDELSMLLEALGLVEPGTDVASALRDLLAVGVVGFYDPETDELVVRGTELSPYVRSTVVHELTHALDDQVFELHRPDLEEVEDETTFGFDAVVEGTAQVVTGPLRGDAERGRAERGPTRGAPARRRCRHLRHPLRPRRDPHRHLRRGRGVRTDADRRWVGDGWRRRRLRLAAEHEPRGPRARRVPRRVRAGGGPVPPVDGEPVDEGMFGQLSFELVLGGVLGDDAATDAASAWRGDNSVLWEDDGRSCVRIDTALADDGAEDFVQALEEWAASLPDAEITETDDGLVRATSCTVPGAGGGGSDLPA
ncbi:MAG: hypothetical protein U5R31_02330 [Acidimicrobiia bacterium]|nr:hypothetical protein [Acidimicrobiia bacterium]